MHVSTQTPLAADEIRARFQRVATRPDVAYDADRQPPKFFLTGLPVAPPPAAEVALHPRHSGTEVVLRLMWGPLPAPFPRAVAGAGLLAAVLLPVLLGSGVTVWLASCVAAMLPLGALAYQRRGEDRLQALISRQLDGVVFLPKAH